MQPALAAIPNIRAIGTNLFIVILAVVVVVKCLALVEGLVEDNEINTAVLVTTLPCEIVCDRALFTVAHRGQSAGVDTAVDQVFLHASGAATRSGGTTVCVGAAPITEAIQIAPAALFTASEKKLFGCLLGSSNSLREIPRLIALWQSGRLDLEALITHRRPLEEINEAMDDLSAGRGIRTVLSL